MFNVYRDFFFIYVPFSLLSFVLSIFVYNLCYIVVFGAPSVVQHLRCLANYEALRFSSPILTIGESLVERMRKHSAINGGKYVSVHLRFEEVCFYQYVYIACEVLSVPYYVLCFLI